MENMRYACFGDRKPDRKPAIFQLSKLPIFLIGEPAAAAVRPEASQPTTTALLGGVGRIVDN